VNHDIRPEVYDCAQSSLTIELAGTTAASGCGIADGSISVAVNGGIPPLRFKLGTLEQSESLFEKLPSGVYTISVSDSKGCEAILPNITLNATGLSFEATVISNTDCAGGNGSIEINVIEGNPPYQFKFGEAPFTDSNKFEGLSTGSYEVVAADANACSTVLNVTVTQGNTGTSWSNSIRPLMTTYCARTGCHNGKSRPDLRLYEKAKSYASQIKMLTADRSMPYEGSLTQQQIDLIACWVDEGALDN
jgi:hypothetical protein